MYADTIRSPELRHEVALAIGDPVIYVERDGARQIFAGALELPRLAELDGLEPFAFEALGRDELVAQGLEDAEIEIELVLRACRRAGVTRAVVPRTFPVAAADHLRANGVELAPDHRLFERRRRAKTEAELAGIRRALRAS